ncbi:uncharacterized protein SETTUDRAFT_166862 [Exserohilum turcica Et28A]|uniref:Uncharacterized protein n=1 Tax=Exserohilum turcicum (strain 28A) TaxID=671987 RepID=R0KPP5_EXST2|nr:uncharacterized protein SETTUDRAFT_166862 [Exserohilum turcica Et28A]EOA91004.1 hypothetical protein SETTUDRAFT_166862 [Exserohilum turcica Et28A]
MICLGQFRQTVVPGFQQKQGRTQFSNGGDDCDGLFGKETPSLLPNPMALIMARAWGM